MELKWDFDFADFAFQHTGEEFSGERFNFEVLIVFIPCGTIKLGFCPSGAAYGADWLLNGASRTEIGFQRAEQEATTLACIYMWRAGGGRGRELL